VRFILLQYLFYFTWKLIMIKCLVASAVFLTLVYLTSLRYGESVGVQSGMCLSRHDTVNYIICDMTCGIFRLTIVRSVWYSCSHRLTNGQTRAGTTPDVGIWFVWTSRELPRWPHQASFIPRLLLNIDSILVMWRVTPVSHKLECDLVGFWRKILGQFLLPC